MPGSPDANSQPVPTQPSTYHVDEDSDDDAGEAPPKPWGRLFSENAEQSSIELVKDSYTLGRHVNCEVRFDDPVISNRHCQITRELVQTGTQDSEEYTVFLEDLSSNGTFVNENRLGKSNRVVIKHNDRITLTHKRKPGAATPPTYIFFDCQRETDAQDSPVHRKYHLLKSLGSGACGEVWLAVDKSNGQQWAVKVINKRRFNSLSSAAISNAALMQEVEILQKLDHPCIIKVQEAFDTPEKLYIVLELAKGGEFFERIVSKEKLSESETRLFFLQLFDALQYLHDRGIAHRDLKPENLLLDSSKDETIIKVTDFGLAKLVGPQSFMKTMCGTPSYQAPEVLLANMGRNSTVEGYGPAVDIWSLGVILYICLCGFSPFGEDLSWQTEPLAEQIIKGTYQFKEPFWDPISAEARDLVTRMLTVDPKKRITIKEALKHPFMQDAAVAKTYEGLMNKARERRGVGAASAAAAVASAVADEHDESAKRKR